MSTKQNLSQTFFALLLGMSLAGCLGDATITLAVDDGGDGTGGSDAPLSAAALADATLVAEDAASALDELEVEADIDDIQDELAGIDVDTLNGGLATISPGGGFAPAQDRSVVVRCYHNDNCTTGRIRSLLITESLRGDIRTARITELHLHYAATPDAEDRGNMDEVTRGTHAYVYADITATTELRDGEVTAAVLTGWRHWHSDPAVRFLFFDLQEIMPDHVRAPFARMRWSGGWDVAIDEPGSFERMVTLRDGRTDVRTWTVDENSSVPGVDLSLAYRRTAPDGTSTEASGMVNLGGTRHCRLDDSGSMHLLRMFAAADTDVARPVSEVVDHNGGDGEHEIAARLYLANGTELERHSTRRVIAPTNCNDARFPRVVETLGSSYRGVAFEATLTKTALDVLQLEATRTATDGTMIELTVSRVGRVATVVAERFDAVEHRIGLLELEVDPTGVATGTLTRFDDEGQVVEIIEIERDLSGRFSARRAGAAREQAQRINRGEL